ncbi:SNF1-related protein kinase regulatory subunit gamma-1-like [Lolium rigidum]|uniref:SNF1-related protein kinase regulatory subunit gamma-1-like n=1 Tax=Lolium rigidum TaxID=89674 RepID=UPI001F5C227E|nr:SNF1-related protein kinase regulatory subunit gamma-1-like [Lolium rigidum]
MYADKREGIYVVNGEGNLDGLIMRGHIIAKLVYELPWYFNGVIPLSQNNMLDCRIPPLHQLGRRRWAGGAGILEADTWA